MTVSRELVRLLATLAHGEDLTISPQRGVPRVRECGWPSPTSDDCHSAEPGHIAMRVKGPPYTNEKP